MARESKRKREERRFGRPDQLADMMVNCRWVLPSYVREASDPEAFRLWKEDSLDCLSTSPVIAAGNVAEYLYAGNDKEVWHYTQDFPSCVPPFPSMFLEFTRPSCVNSEGSRRSSSIFPDRWGWLMLCESRAEALGKASDSKAKADQIKSIKSQLDMIWPMVDQAALEQMASRPDRASAIETMGTVERTFMALAATYQHLSQGGNISDALPERVAWIVNARLFVGGAGAVTSPANCSFAVAEDGTIVDEPAFGTMAADQLRGESMDDVRGTWSAMMLPAALAISFMNCKNVTLDPVEPDARLNRERRAGLKPFVRYHTINIEPMKRVLKSEGGVEEHGLKKALHICRGHFATYADRMFGRELEKPVTVWRPAHVRGSAKEGIVVSDYRVNAPKGGHP